MFSNAPDIRSGLTANLAGMITGIWTAFEVLASDLWEKAINAHPSELSSLKGRPPNKNPVFKKKRKALADPNDTDDEEHSKFVRLSYLQGHNYNLSGLMGTVLREKFNFQVLDGILAAYVEAFDKSHADVRDAILHPCFIALSASRNVLVHKGGIVDDEFMGNYKKCEALRSTIPGAEEGKPLPLDGQIVKMLVVPAIEQSVKLIQSVSKFVGTGEQT